MMVELRGCPAFSRHEGDGPAMSLGAMYSSADCLGMNKSPKALYSLNVVCGINERRNRFKSIKEWQ